MKLKDIWASQAKKGSLIMPAIHCIDRQGLLSSTSPYTNLSLQDEQGEFRKVPSRDIFPAIVVDNKRIDATEILTLKGNLFLMYKKARISIFVP